MTLSERLIKEGMVVIDRNNGRRSSSNAIFKQAGINALRARQQTLKTETSTVNDLLVSIDLTQERVAAIA